MFIMIRVGDHDVRGLDISMEKTLFVRVIKRSGNSADDSYDLSGRHAAGVPSRKMAAGIDTINEVHRNPQLPVTLAAVMDADDMWMPKL